MANGHRWGNSSLPDSEFISIGKVQQKVYRRKLWQKTLTDDFSHKEASKYQGYFIYGFFVESWLSAEAIKTKSNQKGLLLLIR